MQKLFEPIEFSRLNEADVREEILAPLIRALGYRTGSVHNVIREQSLRYNRLFLGRRNPRRDPIIRGRADYILEAHGSIRWVIEAKAPGVVIGIDEVEQSWSYANHPEIRAVYFSVCNGRNFQVFQTNLGPNKEAIFSITYEDMDEQFPQMLNLLSPDSIRRDHPVIVRDLEEPLGPGLRSFVRIANGLIKYERNNLGWRVLSEFQTGISEGAIERDEAGRMVAFLQTTGPSRSLQELNNRLGLSTFEMISTDSTISDNSDSPTIFSYENAVIIPSGEKLLDLRTWTDVILPSNITCQVSVKASGIVKEKKFFGIFTTCMNYNEFSMRIEMVGSFEIVLA